MIDREKPSTGFLERWSRRKLEAERDAPERPAETENSNLSPDEPGPPQRPSKSGETPAQAAPKAEFDLTSLPSLDSITAGTDIRGFLAPGVPTELARAALRRAWSADSAIRDFKGLAENDWDFTDPAAMPGFSALPQGYDIKKMVAQILGDGEKPNEPDAAANQPDRLQEPDKVEEIAPPATGAELPSTSSREDECTAPESPLVSRQVSDSHHLVHRSDNNAPHNSTSADEQEEPKTHRQHGRALPK